MSLTNQLLKVEGAMPVGGAMGKIADRVTTGTSGCLHYQTTNAKDLRLNFQIVFMSSLQTNINSQGTHHASLEVTLKYQDKPAVSLCVFQTQATLLCC